MTDVDKLRHQNEGRAELIIVTLVLLASLLFSGVLFGPKKLSEPANEVPVVVTTPSADTTTGTITPSLSCCDTPSCEPQTDTSKSFTYNGRRYGLIRSNIQMLEGENHLKKTSEAFNGNPIIVNTTDEFSEEVRRNPNIVSYVAECGDSNHDQLASKDGKQCIAIPNDLIVYVCKQNCTEPPRRIGGCGHIFSCFGAADSVYDVYARIGDTIPNEIKNCGSLTSSGTSTTTKTSDTKIVVPTPDPKNNLQINAMQIYKTFYQITTNSVTWLSPWCKPAIYLYPPEKTDVLVQVKSSQPLTYTDPLYPPTGWFVTAYPTGQLFYGNKLYDYLYYETQISDEQLLLPKEGFSIKYSGLFNLMNIILPQLGLNEKERTQFVDYWAKVLPKSPYYTVKIVSPRLLDEIIPLAIFPKPDATIRVTLHFTPTEEKIDLPTPLVTSVNRTGFTVVEWGGIFKKDKNYPFSCVM